MSTDNAGYAEDFAAIFSTNTKTVLKAALGRSCQATAVPYPEPLLLLPDGKLLQLRLAFSGAMEGAINLLMSQKDGAILADLLMMGDGSTPWTDDQFDAMKEIGNQLAGSLATNQGERWSAAVSNAGASCESWERSEPDGALFAFTLEIQGVTNEPMVLWLEETLLLALKKHEDAQNSLAAVTEALAGLNLDFGAPSPPPKAAPTFGGGGVATAAPPVTAMPPASAPAAGGTSTWIDSTDPSLARLLDVPIEVSIELGKTELSIRRVLEIGPGSIIELDRTAGEPVDLVVNDKIVARGEVVVIDENFGIRITHLVSPEERIRQMR
jgi:flagellar motor switch protein FliN